MKEPAVLDELKNLILYKNGIRAVTPSDCKRISIEISKTIKKNVSETTIKRLFGFAIAKHNFSKFTITTLSEYVSEELPVQVQNSFLNGDKVEPKTWTEVQDQASKITEYTLKSIKNRSGMPYELTINRKFAVHDFEVFFKSDYTYTAFISQPGYGRSILLSHLCDRLIYSNQDYFKGSTVVFLTASSFLNNRAGVVNFEDHLKAQLGISAVQSLICLATEAYKLTGGKLIIILDGFSELELKKDFKKELFESMINFICAIDESKCIKLVLSMRSTTWIRFYNDIRHSAFLQSKWFQGSYFNLGETSNVPPLTEKEIDQIIDRIGQTQTVSISSELKQQLKYPLHIQLWYQLTEEDAQFHYMTSITFYELIFRHVRDKIYRSNYYTEKMQFLKKLIHLTDYGRKGNSVLKDELISEMSSFRNAYMELLSDGILMSEKSQEEYHPMEYIRFIHHNVFDYFLFIELVEKFCHKIDRPFFGFINSEYQNDHTRIQLLQWTIRYIVRTLDFKNLSCIFNFKLNNFEKNYLLLFIAESLHYQTSLSPQTVKLLHSYQLHDTFINELINFDFIDSSYIDAISALLKVTENREHLFIYHAILTVFDILSLNRSGIEDRMEFLIELRTGDWIADPHEISQLIVAKLLNSNAQIDGIVLSKIEHSMNHLNPAELTVQQAISYVFIILLFQVYEDNDKSSQIIQLISQHQPEIYKKRPLCAIFMLTLLIFNGNLSSSNNEIIQMQNIVELLELTEKQPTLSKYTEWVLKLISANSFKAQGNYTEAYELYVDCLELFKKSRLNLICLHIYSAIIEILTETNDPNKVNEYKYERLCFMEHI
jgi:hypothetical protein